MSHTKIIAHSISILQSTCSLIKLLSGKKKSQGVSKINVASKNTKTQFNYWEEKKVWKQQEGTLLACSGLNFSEKFLCSEIFLTLNKNPCQRHFRPFPNKAKMQDANHPQKTKQKGLQPPAQLCVVRYERFWLWTPWIPTNLLFTPGMQPIIGTTVFLDVISIELLTEVQVLVNTCGEEYTTYNRQQAWSPKVLVTHFFSSTKTHK